MKLLRNLFQPVAGVSRLYSILLVAPGFLLAVLAAELIDDEPYHTWVPIGIVVLFLAFIFWNIAKPKKSTKKDT